MDTLEGIDRIRISSIEPELLTEEMIVFMAESNKFLPHYHIPLQSGSDHVLSLMKRKYRREVFEQRVKDIKKIAPHACIAADVIIGFPGETEEEFKTTYDFIDGLDISYMHVFTYSERPGTNAAKLEGKVSSQEKRERSRILHELSDRKKKKFYQSNIGSKRKVLFESDNSGGFMHGFTGNYLKVKTKYDASLINQIVEVELDVLTDDLVFHYKP
jgi:threonylcarbamoyladenosine tRNA methylthiotransferase MtaB